MADELAKCNSLQSDSLSLTGDTLDLSKSKVITSEDDIADSLLDNKSVVRPKIPNGVVAHDLSTSDHSTTNCECTEDANVCHPSAQPSRLCLSGSNADDAFQKQNELTDSADSGVHSGTDNGSDVKSSSSSPGLSTESSVQDLCEKSSELKKWDTQDKTQSVKNDLVIVNELALSVANKVNLGQDECDSNSKDVDNGIEYVVYESELQMPDIMRLITKDLSEPYSIYTYRYFIHNWPKLCFLAMEGSHCVGAIVCKLDMHKKMVRRGYIAMLAVDQNCRRKGIGSHLVLKAIRAMIRDDCDEVVLETEITNKAALRLYENLGFVRDKRLFRYYLNGVDALRLKLWLR